jgi:hypothetical protein
VKRYQEEQHIIAKRVKRYRQLSSASLLGLSGEDYMPTTGLFRKTLKCGGCRRARCQACHPEKFPKRLLTRQEQQAQVYFREEVQSFDQTNVDRSVSA